MVQVNARSIEAKILRVLLERYPIDMDEVVKITGLSKKEVERSLKGMQARKWVILEVLPNKIFIRLKRFDFTFLGRDETQRKAVKHKGKDRKKKRIKQDLLRDEHDDEMMYA
jgi:DNA-binding transcriptional regulator GbsR (MarR family)